MAWKQIINKAFSVNAFDAYCHGLVWDKWRPTMIVLHNTAVPNLADRPRGFTDTHMRNLESYYRDQQKWSAGPHLFVDDTKIWVFTPLTMSGVHSPSWNKLSLGVEMLGDFSKESFSSGRGANVRTNTTAAIATLCAVLGIDPDEKLKLHKEDPATTHVCPGAKVVKSEIISEVKMLLVNRHGGEHDTNTPCDK